MERVEIQNNQYLQGETLLFYVSTKAGDRYDEARLKDDFRRLWATGFLDDLILDVRDSPAGKLVAFRVVERKRIQIVDYRGSKALSTTNIEDKLKEEDQGLKIDTFYDVSKARKVETVIAGMLRDKGYPFATVKHEAKTIGGAGQQVSFVIQDGPKAQIKQIDFVGNQAFSDDELRGRLKKVKQPGPLQPLLAGRQDHLDRRQVERREGRPGRRLAPPGLLPGPRLRHGAGGRAPGRLPRRPEGGEAGRSRRSTPGWRSRSPRATSTAWAGSSSRA